MKRILEILLIFCLFIPLFAQESTEEKPESYFNDLIVTLNKEEEKVAPKQEEKASELPKPATLLGTEVEKEDVKTVSESKTETKVASQTAPASVPASVPAPVQTTVTKSVTTPTITLAKPAPEKSKKDDTGDEEEVVEGKEKRLFNPYIEIPHPKTRSQKVYVKKLEKRQKSRMRLITLDGTDIIHSRVNRSVRSILESPANLGLRSEYPNSISIIPVNNIDIDIKTSTEPFVFMEEYFSTGELLTTERKDSMLAMLGEDGLELPIDISLPTVLGFKFNLMGGSLYGNAGLFVQERMRIPNEFWGLLFDGATVTEPFSMTEEMGINVNTYTKLSAGYGTYFELPLFLGELRFGASANAYAGAFSGVNITNLSLIPGTESTRAEGTLEVLSFMDTLSLLPTGGSSEFNPVFSLEDDYLTIPKMNLGCDLGVAWRFKLNRLLPIFPKLFKNYIDVQVGLEDVGAKIKMRHAYLREISFEAEAGDLINMFTSGEELDISSLTVLEENLVYDDTTLVRPLGTKLNIAVQYQPISLIMLKGSYSEYITEGINSNSGENYSYGVEVFPFRALSIHGTVYQKGQYRYSEAGIRMQSMRAELGLTLRVYDLDFSLTENISGAGLKLYWSRYF